jgi:hypothetical protein
LFLLSREFIVFGVPGYAHLPAARILYRELFIAPAEALCRETAPRGFDPNSTPRVNFGRQQVCTAITPASNQNCTMMAKIAPRFAPDGLIKFVTKTRNPADALWSTQRRLLTLTAGPLRAHCLPF